MGDFEDVRLLRLGFAPAVAADGRQHHVDVNVVLATDDDVRGILLECPDLGLDVRLEERAAHRLVETLRLALLELDMYGGG